MRLGYWETGENNTELGLGYWTTGVRMLYWELDIGQQV